ncbi:hypothetical protein [Bacteroides sp.]|uniref:hypothetical protein n=1 Tax=Bacteroides sp. TaxID=29523 RepID=UPI002639757F|nr:hypothetical protein [Bacteroides sp.]MDD3039553.1 hypothetical protein [Bacteroides sp.]
MFKLDELVMNEFETLQKFFNRSYSLEIRDLVESTVSAFELMYDSRSYSLSVLAVVSDSLNFLKTTVSTDTEIPEIQKRHAVLMINIMLKQLLILTQTIKKGLY